MSIFLIICIPYADFADAESDVVLIEESVAEPDANFIPMSGSVGLFRPNIFFNGSKYLRVFLHRSGLALHTSFIASLCFLKYIDNADGEIPIWAVMFIDVVFSLFS